jgi:UDP-N-acetyl-D-mannosaminuronic acid dehydrogenase
MKVCVLGLGYIGLPTAAMLAVGGHSVVGYDLDERILEALDSGSPLAGEEGVRAVVRRALASGALTSSRSVIAADAYIICVPTPTIDHRPDLRAVQEAAAAIARVAEPGSLIVLESTVPPGTTERIIAAAFRTAGKDPGAFGIVHCPERVIPGAIVEELRGNDRVIGGRRPGDAEKAAALYRSFVSGRMHCTDCTTAEFVKVVENTYRDVNIAFANELALLAEELGVDAWETIRLANNHPRVDILSPGPGVGGHCIPVDPHFLSNANPFVTELIQAARRINERMPHVVVRRVMEHVSSAAPGSTIAILGASYKADVDDARESPTIRLDELLREHGFNTRIYDPHVTKFVRPLAASIEEAVEDAEALVLMVAHQEFREINPHALNHRMRRCVVLDTRAFLDVVKWRAAGFQTYVLGARRPKEEGVAFAAAG